MTEAPRVLAAEVVVVGAGPAGLAAARAAAAQGASVLVLDAAPAAGGQIWRARRGVAAAPVRAAMRGLSRAGVRVLAGAQVALALPGRELLVETGEGACRVRGGALVVATGARERLLPFPGWTLPGVFGAGGLQALAKGGWPVAGRRVLVAGSGPLLLAAAATLRREGAHVVAIAQEPGAAALARFAAGLAAHPRQASAALRLGLALAGVPVLAGWRVVAAEGEEGLERVRLARADGRERVVRCDALAASWGLVPQAELGAALGCAIEPRLGAPAIRVDAAQRTSVAGVFAAGECAGVAGVRAAVLQGDVAGAAAAREARDGAPAPAGRVARALARELAFAARAAAAFPVPRDWAARLHDDTLVCRCEDVAWSALRAQPDLRAAKLATRCGMGHCQGRLCHDALAAITGAARLPARPPLVPVALGALLAAAAPEPPPAPVSNPET
jgi:NADPH-dependent 2,4-dienoyl-CoA reductase/sulfur reductase-like enzyme